MYLLVSYLDPGRGKSSIGTRGVARIFLKGVLSLVSLVTLSAVSLET